MSHTINRRGFIRQALGGVTLLTMPALPALALPEKKKPNLLFLFTDDQTHASIAALGNGKVHTPNLDRLAHRGASFTNCYNQGGWHGAICVASRTMLLTGRYLWKAKTLEAHLHEECAERRLWPQYLEQAGYRTFMSGKWHVNCEAERVFQSVGTVRPGMAPDIPAQYNRPMEGVPDPFDPADPALGGFYSGGKHWSEVLGDEGIAFLQDASKQDSPFFMYLAFNAPHDPRQAPREYQDLYEEQNIPVPENFLPAHPDKEKIGCDALLRDERLAPFPRTEFAVHRQRREYYAAITHLDTQIGRLLDTLDTLGLTETTVVIFTSDNGLALGSHGLMGKQSMYDHSMKVPLILAGPGIPAGHRVDTPVYMQAILPTSLELAGLEVPDSVDFHSLLPLLQGTGSAQDTAIYGAYMNTQRMVRVGRHKLIHFPKLDRFLLFDLEKDPLEQHNLAEDPDSATLVKSLKVALRRLQEEQGDKLRCPE